MKSKVLTLQKMERKWEDKSRLPEGWGLFDVRHSSFSLPLLYISTAYSSSSPLLLYIAKTYSIPYQARALRALGLLLADGTPTVGGGKTF